MTVIESPAVSGSSAPEKSDWLYELYGVTEYSMGALVIVHVPPPLPHGLQRI